MQRKQDETIYNYENLIDEMKLIIYSFLSYKDLCRASLVSKKEDQLACNVQLWNDKVKTDFYRESISNIHPKLFYQHAMEFERDLFVAFHKAAFVDMFLDCWTDCGIYNIRGRFHYCIKFEKSFFPFLNELNDVINQIRNSAKFSQYLEKFENDLAKEERQAKKEFNALVTKPDELKPKKKLEFLELLCSMDAHHTLGLIYRKSTVSIDLSRLLTRACHHLKLNTVRRMIELGAEVNNNNFIKGNDERCDLVGPPLVYHVVNLAESFWPVNSPNIMNNSASIKNIGAITKLLLENGADPDQFAYNTEGDGSTRDKKVFNSREYCQAMQTMLVEDGNHSSLANLDLMIKQVCKMIIDSPQKKSLNIGPGL